MEELFVYIFAASKEKSLQNCPFNTKVFAWSHWCTFMVPRSSWDIKGNPHLSHYVCSNKKSNKIKNVSYDKMKTLQVLFFGEVGGAWAVLGEEG